MEEIKIIEEQINNLIGKGKDLFDLKEKLDKELNINSTDSETIKEKKIKFLNSQFKSSQRRIIVEYKDGKLKGYSHDVFKVGTNKNGIGIIDRSYQNNLIGLKNDNYALNFFIDVLKEKPEIKEKLLSLIEDEETKKVVEKFLELKKDVEQERENIIIGKT